MRRVWALAISATMLAGCGSSKTTSGAATTAAGSGTTVGTASTASTATAASGTASGNPTTTGGTTAAGSASVAAKPTGAPFKILFIGALSGPLAAIGQAQVIGLKAGISRVNDTGGVAGRPVELSTEDDQGDATKAVTALQQHLSSGKPDMVVPGITSDTGAALLPILTENKIFSFAALVSKAVSLPAKFPEFFSIAQNQQNAYNALADKAKADGEMSIAYLRPDTAAGETDVAQLKTAATKDGLTVTDVVYSPAAVDLTQSMQQALDAKPALIVLDAYGPSAGYLLQARFKLNVTTPTIGALIFTLGNPTAYVQPAQMQGVTLETPKFLVSDPSQPDSAAKTDFITRVKAQGEIKGVLTLYSGLYDVIQLVQVAAAQAGSADGAALKTALESLKEPAVKPYVTYGSVQYSADNHLVLPPVTDYTFIKTTSVKDGQFQVAG